MFTVNFKINFKIYIIDLFFVVICRTLVSHFSLLRDVIISCVCFFNDILFVFMIEVDTMDYNAEILRVIVIWKRLVLLGAMEMNFAATHQHHC